MAAQLEAGLHTHFWNMFFSILGIIIPTDFHSIILQRGRLNHQPVIHLAICHSNMGHLRGLTYHAVRLTQMAHNQQLCLSVL